MRFGTLPELDEAVVAELERLGAGRTNKPYIRPVPNDDMPMWEVGWEGEYSDDVRQAAGMCLDRHLKLPVEKRRAGRISMLQFVIEGKRPIFIIPGRDPTTRDVAELERRDWEYRHSFEKRLLELEQQACGEDEDTKDKRIASLARSLADDVTLYQMLEFGRKSVLVQGMREGWR